MNLSKKKHTALATVLVMCLISVSASQLKADITVKMYGYGALRQGSGGQFNYDAKNEEIFYGENAISSQVNLSDVISKLNCDNEVTLTNLTINENSAPDQLAMTPGAFTFAAMGSVFAGYRKRKHLA